MPQNILVGAGAGSSDVTLFNAAGTALTTVTTFEAEFSGGVRTALADVNDDGVPDLIAGNGPGRVNEVRVFDGKTGAMLHSFFPFETSFTGGVFVTAGDINGDGFADIVVTPDAGGGPRVAVVSGKDQTRLADFFGIDDMAFRGGAGAALADINGDGKLDILVTAGVGGGPRLAGFDGSSLVIGITPPKLFADFFVFEETLRSGVFVVSGDLNGDGKADVIASSGLGGGPRVYVLSGDDLLASGVPTPLANYFAGDTESRDGLRIAAKDLDGDGRADIITGSGSSGVVSTYLATAIMPDGTPETATEFDAFPGSANGVFVG